MSGTMVVSQEDRTVARYLCNKTKHRGTADPLLQEIGTSLGIPFPDHASVEQSCRRWLPQVDFNLLEQETFQALDKGTKAMGALRHDVATWNNREATLTFEQFESWFLDRVQEYGLYAKTKNMQKMQELKGTLQSNQLANIIREKYGPKGKASVKVTRKPTGKRRWW